MVVGRDEGSNWGAIAPFAGLATISIAFGLGLYIASLNYPNEQRYQSYRHAVDKPLEIDRTTPQPKAELFEYREPCKNPKGENESDLCAQWRAVRAAENSVSWTESMFWATVASLVLNLIGIFLVRATFKEAQKGNYLARQAERAFLYLENHISFKHGRLEVKVANYGRSQGNILGCEIKEFTSLPNKNEAFHSLITPELNMPLIKVVRSEEAAVVRHFEPPLHSVIRVQVLYMSIFNTHCQTVGYYVKTKRRWTLHRYTGWLAMT